jgi:ABC-type branched-subunit amino acid transport system substrate-binding protein
VRRALVAAAVLAAAVALGGCKSLDNVARGGKVVGDTLTVYSLLPQPGTGNARDFVDAEKLALFGTGGTAGEFAVNFVSIDEGRRSALELRDALADPQLVALIGPVSSDTAMSTVPLLNEAGVIEQEPGPVADGLVKALHDAGARTVGDPARADAVIYAGEDDLDNAVGVADALAREAPDAVVVLPSALTFAGIEGRLTPAARKRAVLLSSAPEPGSTPALRDFAARFRERYGRAPGPYAIVGYRAMGAVLDAIERAGDRAGYRQAVIDAYFGQAGLPAPFTAFRPGRGYLDLD